MASSGAGPSAASSLELRRSTTVVTPMWCTSFLTSAADSSCRLSARSNLVLAVFCPSSVGKSPRSRTLTAPSSSIHAMTTPSQIRSRAAEPAMPEQRPGERGTLAAPDPGAPDTSLMQGQARQAEEQQTGYGEPRVGGGSGGIDNPGDGEEDRRDDGKHAYAASHTAPQ